MTFGLNSLRAKTLAVVCVLVVAPVVFVWLSSPFEDALGYQMRNDLGVAAGQVADLVRIDAPHDEYLEMARRFDVWIRVVEKSGEVTESADGTAPTFRERLLFAPDPVPELAEWDATQPPLHERGEIREAMRSGRAGRCGYRLEGRLLVCHLAERIEFTGRKPKVVHVPASSARGATGLYDERFQVLKLMGLVLALAAGLGIWLAYRIARPLRFLREQVLARTEPPVSTRPVERGEDDEFGELADAFNQLLGSLEERRKANEAFMADMAHEIKNPVAAVRAVAESLGKGKEISAKRAERLANILGDSSRRLDRVVTNFLELARAESGLPEAEREDVQVGKLVENAMGSYAADDRYEELDLVVDCDDVWVSGSADHIERALRNLVENALSFAESAVEVRVRRFGDTIEIRVADDGPGIAPEDVPRVFDRFFTRRDDGGGTGLGLAMTRAIVEAHSGTIDVESTVGEGTTFTIALPRLDALDVRH
jgi:two-component system sensor histidine kinase ChvG